MKRRPEARRKVPKYFDESEQVYLQWTAQGWAVRLWCDQLHRWDWENLSAVRIGKKLEAEAKAAAIKLLRESAARHEEAAGVLLTKAKRLANSANGIESRKRDL